MQGIVVKAFLRRPVLFELNSRVQYTTGEPGSSWVSYKAVSMKL